MRILYIFRRKSRANVFISHERRIFKNIRSCVDSESEVGGFLLIFTVTDDGMYKVR